MFVLEDVVAGDWKTLLFLFVNSTSRSVEDIRNLLSDDLN